MQNLETMATRHWSSLDADGPSYIDLRPPEAWASSFPSVVNDDSLSEGEKEFEQNERESGFHHGPSTPATAESSSLNTNDREALNHADESYTNTSNCVDSIVTESLSNQTLASWTEYHCEWASKCDYHCSDYKEFFHHVGEHLRGTRIEQRDDGTNQLFCDWKSCGFSTEVANELLAHVLYHAIHTRAKAMGVQVYKEWSVKVVGYQPRCSDPSSRNEIPILPSEFICDWTNCGHRFANPQLFYWHALNHVDFEGREICRWRGCNYTGDRTSRLKRHVQMHTGERSFSCPFCGLFFSSRERIREHWSRMEQLMTPADLREGFDCTKCDKSFASEKLLQEHQRVHRSSSQVSCPHCGPTKVFPYQSKLERHIVQVHSGRRGFKCQFCSYMGKTDSDLKRHVERHENTVVYKCSQPGCLESFLTPASLRNHVRKVHKGPDTRDRFVCHLCGKNYTYVSSLGRHLEQSHRLEPAPPSLRFKIETNEDGSRSVVNAVPIAPENTDNDANQAPDS